MTEQRSEWMASGDCVEGCTSPPVCPGYWNSPMQAQLHEGKSQCEGVWTFNINKGYYKEIDLSGLLVSCAFNSPSAFPGPQGAPWKAIIYIDEKANSKQVKALERIYRTCWATIGDVIKVKSANIRFEKEFVDGGPAAKYRVRIDGVYTFAARPFRTQNKKPRYINSYWGGHVNVGISEVNEFNDPDLPRGKWNAPGMSITYYDFIVNSDKHHWLP
jgi:hypothetical protein